MVTNIKEIKEQNFTIKIGQIKDQFAFTVYRSVGNHLLGRGSEKTRDEALLAAKKLISDHNTEKELERVNGVPTAKEFAEALETLDSQGKIHTGMWTMLKAHHAAPGLKLTSRQLSTEAGYSTYSGANRHYGSLGKLLSEYLEFSPPHNYDDGSPLLISVLTSDDEKVQEDELGEWQHNLRQEIADALDLLNARGFLNPN